VKSEMETGAGYAAAQDEVNVISELTSRIFLRPAPVGVVLINSNNEIENGVVRKRRDKTIGRVRTKIASFSSE
jgi:hypothetical protein